MGSEALIKSPPSGNKTRRVCLSVVSHGQGELVDRLLASLVKHLQPSYFDFVVVVTHNIEEEPIDKEEISFPVVEIHNLRRKGFGNNHNCAFEKSSPDVFMIVNPDIELTEALNLDDLVAQLPETGLASPLVCNVGGELEDFRRADLTPWNLFLRKLGREPESVDWLAGMFIIVNAAHFRDLNGFDPRYFMYVEDCDLSFRSTKLGGAMVTLEDTRVVHDAQRASRRNFRHLRWHVSSLLTYWSTRVRGFRI